MRGPKYQAGQGAVGFDVAGVEIRNVRLSAEA